MKIELTYEELFLIEMAIDDVLYRLQDPKLPSYEKYHILDQKIYSIRVNAEKSNLVKEH